MQSYFRQFQFHLVRLKPDLATRRHSARYNFNSTWSD